jgi:hypothetical protein
MTFEFERFPGCRRFSDGHLWGIGQRDSGGQNASAEKNWTAIAANENANPKKFFRDMAAN